MGKCILVDDNLPLKLLVKNFAKMIRDESSQLSFEQPTSEVKKPTTWYKGKILDSSGKYQSWICSVCGKTIELPIKDEFPTYAFCPHCCSPKAMKSFEDLTQEEIQNLQ